MRQLLKRLAAITFGSLLFVSLKTILVALLHWLTTLPAWLNYFIVSVSVSLLGWVYHSLVSFRVPLNRETLIRYVQQAVVLKVLDFCLYNGFVYAAHVDVRWAVLVTGAVVFVTRAPVYLKYVFVPVSGDIPRQPILGE